MLNNNECAPVKMFHTIVPLSAINTQQQKLLDLIQCGPVALTANDRIAGVLLSPMQWDAIAKTLEATKACLAVLDASVGRQE